MPDGSVWGVPAEVIADNYAKFYAEKGEDYQWRITLQAYGGTTMCSIDEIIEVFEEMDLDDVDLGCVTPGEIITHLKAYKRLTETINSTAIECVNSIEKRLIKVVEKHGNGNSDDVYTAAMQACEDAIAKLKKPKIPNGELRTIRKTPVEKIYWETDQNGTLVAKSKIVYEETTETYHKPYACRNCIAPCTLVEMNLMKLYDDAKGRCPGYTENR